MKISSESSEYDEFGNKIEKEPENSSETTFESISDRIDLLNSDEPVYKELRSKVYEINAFEDEYFDAIAAIPNRILNVVVLGDKSSGKTTFIEHLNLSGACRSTGSARVHTLYEKKFRITTRISPSTNLYADSRGRSKILTFIDTPGHCDFIKFHRNLFTFTNNFVITVNCTEPFSSYHDYLFRKIGSNIILVITKIDLIIDNGADFMVKRIQYYTRPVISHIFVSSSRFNFITDELDMDSIRTLCECYTKGEVQESKEPNFIDKLVHIPLKEHLCLGHIYFNRQLYRLQISGAIERSTAPSLLNIGQNVVLARKTYLNIPVYVQCEPPSPTQAFQRLPVSVMVKTKHFPVDIAQCIFMNSRIKPVLAAMDQQIVVIEGTGERYLDHMLWELKNIMSVDFTVISVFCTYFESLGQRKERDEEQKNIGRDEEQQCIGRYEEQKSVGRDEEQQCIGRDEEQKSVGRDEEQKSVGRDEEQKSIGRDEELQSIGRDEGISRDLLPRVVLSPNINNKGIILKRIPTYKCFYTRNNNIVFKNGTENEETRNVILDILSRGMLNVAGIVNLTIELSGNEDEQIISKELTNSFKLYNRIIYVYNYKIQILLRKKYLDAFEHVARRRKIKKIQRSYVEALDVYLIVGIVNAIESLGLESDISLCAGEKIKVSMMAYKCTRLSEGKAGKVQRLMEEVLNIRGKETK